MKEKTPKPLLVRILVGLQLLLGVGAVASGALLMLSPDGGLMHMPLNMIEGAPFASFFIPGLILFLFVGIYPLCVTYGLWKQPDWTWPDAINPFKQFHWSWAGSLAAGVIVILWLSVELIWVSFMFLHTTYFIWAGLILLLTLSPAVRRYSKRKIKG